MTVMRSALGAALALAVGLPTAAHATDFTVASGFMSNERLGLQDSRGAMAAVSQDVATKDRWTANVLVLQGTRRHEENEVDLNGFYQDGDVHGQVSVFFLATRPIFTAAIGVEHPLTEKLALQGDLQGYAGDYRDVVASGGLKYSFTPAVSGYAGQSWNSEHDRGAVYFGASWNVWRNVTIGGRVFVNDFSRDPHERSAKGFVLESNWHF